MIPKGQSLAIAAVFALVCSSALALVAVDGPGSDDEIANMRLGPDDVKIDTIEVHSLWDPVGVEVRNVGENSVHVIILHRSLVIDNVERGEVNWESIVSPLTADEFQEIVIDSGSSWQTEVSTPSVGDTHLILVKTADGGDFSEVRITMQYVTDELIWSAMLLSIPAFLIGGLVLAQAVKSEDEMGEQASDEES